MALNVPSYPLAYSTTPATNAYAWITAFMLDFTNDGGWVQVGVNLDSASADAGLAQIDQFPVALGSPMANGNVFPNLDTLVASAATYASTNTSDPFSSMRAVLYDALLTHPKLTGATLNNT